MDRYRIEAQPRQRPNIWRLIRDENAFQPAYEQEDTTTTTTTTLLLTESSSSADSIQPTKSSQRLINTLDGLIERIQPIKKDSKLVMSCLLFFPFQKLSGGFEMNWMVKRLCGIS